MISAEFVQQRLIPAAMEPRGVLAVPSPYGGDITLYSATQVPHILKVMVAATTGIPEQKIRVVAPAVGGGFGAKLNINPDEILAVTLAHRLGRPVRWTETRSEAASRPTRVGASSRRSRSQPTRTASSTAFGCTSTPTWAPT